MATAQNASNASTTTVAPATTSAAAMEVSTLFMTNSSRINDTSTAKTTTAVTMEVNTILTIICSDDQGPGVGFTETDFWIFQCVWMVFCCTGYWSKEQPLRLIALLAGLGKATIELVFLEERRITLSWFLIFLLGRIDIDTSREGLLKAVVWLTWMALDVAVYLIDGPLRVGEVMEALTLTFFLVYLIVSTMTKYGGRDRCEFWRICVKMWWVLGWIAPMIARMKGANVSVPMAGWFMLYPIFFPKGEARRAGRTPPPQRRVNGLNLERAQREEDLAQD